MRALMEKLLAGTALTCAEYAELIGHWRDVDRAALFDAARAACAAPSCGNALALGRAV